MIEMIDPEGAPLTVLFVDCDNTSRSLMAEALLRHRSHGRIRAYSAGTAPGAVVDPDALATLGAARVPADGLQPKSWDAFRGADGPAVDMVITVCDGVADRVATEWSAATTHVHWPMEDPAAAGDAPGERRVVFDHVRRKLEAAVDHLIEAARSDDPAAIEAVFATAVPRTVSA